MTFTLLNTRAQVGIDAPPVDVEVHISNGLPMFTMVGLPETAVREARDRVRSAILNSGFEFPARRITVNLAPADLPKQGGRYDLAIALGILAASAQVDAGGLDSVDCYAELALNGECRRLECLLPAMIASQRAGRNVIIPVQNRDEAALLPDLPARLAASLAAVCASLNGGDALPEACPSPTLPPDPDEIDLADVIGQQQAKRALEIAAAGGHHLLMVGPPGCGKSMLAQRLNGLLPPLDDDEAMQCASIRSVSRQALNPANWRQRPFRSPHHTVSPVALVGGGSDPRPGEISLAHHGVLFLDELTEFDRRSIEVLREPLETGQIHISRASRQALFPARFQLIAAMNPCPGGCDSIRECDCSAEQLSRYRHKLSAPLLDRIDIQLEMARLRMPEISAGAATPEQSSARVRERVARARGRQLERQGSLNARLANRELARHCAIAQEDEKMLLAAIDKLHLSLRSYHKLLRLARSIADLAAAPRIQRAHLAEAISYRKLEKLQA